MKLRYGNKEELITVGNYKYQVEFFISKLIPGKEPKIELREQFYRENTKTKSYYPQQINSLDKALSGEKREEACDKLQKLREDYSKTLQTLIDRTDYDSLKQIAEVIQHYHPDTGINKMAQTIARIFRTKGQSVRFSILYEFTRSALGKRKFDKTSLEIGTELTDELINWENSFYGEVTDDTGN